MRYIYSWPFGDLPSSQSRRGAPIIWLDALFNHNSLHREREMRGDHAWNELYYRRKLCPRLYSRSHRWLTRRVETVGQMSWTNVYIYLGTIFDVQSSIGSSPGIEVDSHSSGGQRPAQQEKWKQVWFRSFFSFCYCSHNKRAKRRNTTRKERERERAGKIEEEKRIERRRLWDLAQ